MREVIKAAAKDFFAPLVVLSNKLCCLLGSHQWTNKAAEGVKPTQEELDGGVAGFWRYARVYCKRCGKDSPRNEAH